MIVAYDSKTKKMTKKAFWEALTERAKEYGFKVVDEDGRKVLREKRTGRCVVTAVAVAVLRKKFPQTDNLEAGEALGLGTAFSTDIGAAADNLLNPDNKSLARKLCRAVGVEFPKA